MNKQDLIKHLAANADVSNKQAEAVLNALTTTVLDTVRAGNELAITDLGKFGTAQRAAKTGRNPKTGPLSSRDRPMPARWIRRWTHRTLVAGCSRTSLTS